MKNRSFYYRLVFIIAIGFFLRFYQLSEFPQPGETRDELQYPWAGITLLNIGTPTSWSYFDSYTNRESIRFGKQEFRLVTPWFDKPLLYPLITGSWMKLNGINSIFNVNFFTLRLIPLLLSIITLTLIALVTKSAFDEKIALLSTLLYATIPSIVFANRLSLTENLLTPFILGAIFLIQSNFESNRRGDASKGSQFEVRMFDPPQAESSKRELGNASGSLPACRQGPLEHWFSALLLSILSGLAFHTKQTGIMLFVFIAGVYFWQKKFKELLIAASIFALFVVLHFAIVAHYNLSLYFNVMSDFRHGHTLVGLPEFPFALFRFQGIGQQDRPFLDGSMLLGYLFLFTLPWWLARFKNEKIIILFVPAFLYLVVVSLIESGATLFSFFGWHVYPLFPFVAIALAVGLYRAWQDMEITQLGILFFFLGISSIRFLFLLLPVNWHYRWQYALIPLLIVMTALQLLPDKLKRTGFKFLFGACLGVNIVTVLFVTRWFPALELPLF